ncbi:MAG TPA: histidinol-phosphatase HisJ family protein [Acidobacteriota bacterium]|nr:histidinol-phosphatase HisJ family protein [Acidobacteriota bacterium]
MIPHDYHVHTRFSADCSATMHDMCAAALASGVPEVGFAEHYDLHPDEQPRDWLDLDRWAEELDRCRRQYAGRLTIRAGIEIGEPHLFTQEVRRMMGRYPFDYSLGSLHWVGRGFVFSPDYFRRPAEEAFSLYFQELEKMTRSGEFEILGHLDVPVRTGFEIYGSYDPSRYEDLIRPVLQNCIDRNIALEVNAGTLRRRAGVLTPGPQILEWYRQMGGRHLTLGSDAHLPSQVAVGLDVAMGAARTAGLKHISQFENRRSQLISLP